MNNRFCLLRKQMPGFSLTEMLIATGIMAIGLVMVATIFPVGMKLTGLSAERSVAAVAADEAFVKIQLYGLRDFADWPAAQIETANGNPNYAISTDATYDFCDDFMFTTEVIVDPVDAFWGTGDDIFTSPGLDGDYLTGGDNAIVDLANEFLYPSVALSLPEEHRYHWSALCRRAGDEDVQATVFVTRRSFPGVSYYGYFIDRTANPTNPAIVYGNTGIWPAPVPINVEYDPTDTSTSTYLRELEILLTDPDLTDTIDNTQWDAISGLTNTVYSFFDEGYTIVNNRDGRIYRILEMRDELPQPVSDGIPDTMVLYEDWQWDGYDSDPLNLPNTVQTETVWVVPPGFDSSRYPCVGVFQKVIRFDDIQ